MKPADTKMPRPILVLPNLEQNALLVHHAAAQARRTGTRVILAHMVSPKPTEKKTRPAIVRIATRLSAVPCWTKSSSPWRPSTPGAFRGLRSVSCRKLCQPPRIKNATEESLVITSQGKGKST